MTMNAVSDNGNGQKANSNRTKEESIEPDTQTTGDRT
jgi:hypothetical protein